MDLRGSLSATAFAPLGIGAISLAVWLGYLLSGSGMAMPSVSERALDLIGVSACGLSLSGLLLAFLLRKLSPHGGEKVVTIGLVACLLILLAEVLLSPL